MLPTTSATPLAGSWPSVHEARPGVFVIRARYVHVLCWQIIWRLGAVLAICTALVVLAMAIPAILIAARQFTPMPTGAWLIDQLFAARLAIADFTRETFPAFCQMIQYRPGNSVDFVLLGLFVIVFRLRPAIAGLYAIVLVVLLWPVLSSRLHVTLTREWVVVHRWFRSLRLRRGGAMDGGVSFRAIAPRDEIGLTGILTRMLLPKNQPPEYGSVSAMLGLRSYRIATPRRAVYANKMVEALHECLSRTRGM